MLKDLTIVCLAGCEWDFTWQPTQEVMLRLAQAGNRVLYIEPTGTRNIRLADWRRLMDRLRTKAAGVPRSHALPPTLTIYAPLVLPFPHSRLAQRINRWIIQQAIRRWLRGPARPDLFWVYFPSPLNAELIRSHEARAAVYQIMSSAEAARPHPGIVAANDALLAHCDLVFANSRRLQEQAKRVNHRSYLFRAGVNLELFEQADHDYSPPPSDLADLPDPVIGYVGALHQWVDIDLLQKVATGMPDCRFVLLGPLGQDISALQSLPNVRWIGQKPHGEIPRYVRHFDACVIPYVLDDYTETAYPAKLNEYLALGKPVVATPLPELVDYNKEYGEVLHLAGGAPAFIKGLRQALAETMPAMRDQYRRVASQNSWAMRVEEMSRLVEDTLNQPRTSNLKPL